jgi:hypothetical protein
MRNKSINKTSHFLLQNRRGNKWKAYNREAVKENPDEQYHDPALLPCNYFPQPPLANRLKELNWKTTERKNGQTKHTENHSAYPWRADKQLYSYFPMMQLRK